MKKYLTLLLISTVVIISSCSKKNSCDDPVDCLPPVTQTGEGTIACLINGKVFTPGGNQFGGPTQQAYYQYVDGGYYFGLSAILNRDRNKYIGIALRNEVIVEGKSYFLKADDKDSNFGEYTFGANWYQTNENFIGEITFANFDEENGIVSGIFWFDAVDEKGEIVEIREGRFDMKYH